MLDGEAGKYINGTVLEAMLHDRSARCRIAATAVLSTVLSDTRKLTVLLAGQELSEFEEVDQDGIDPVEKQGSISKEDAREALLRTYHMLPKAIAAEKDPRTLVLLLRTATEATSGYPLALHIISTTRDGAGETASEALENAKEEAGEAKNLESIFAGWALGAVVVLCQRLLLVREEHAAIRAQAVAFLSAVLGGGSVSGGASNGEPVAAVGALLNAQELAHRAQQAATEAVMCAINLLAIVQF